MKKAMLIVIAFVGIATVSCKKDKNNDDKVTSVDLITSTSWKIDTVGWDLDKNGDIDSPLPPGYVKPCDLDNTLTFAKDSTGVFDEGAAKCDPDDPQTVSFTWQLSQNDSVMTIAGNLPGQLNGDVDVLLLTNTNLKLSKRVTQSFPVSFDEQMIIALKK